MESPFFGAIAPLGDTRGSTAAHDAPSDTAGRRKSQLAPIPTRPGFGRDANAHHGLGVFCMRPPAARAVHHTQACGQALAPPDYAASATGAQPLWHSFGRAQVGSAPNTTLRSTRLRCLGSVAARGHLGRHADRHLLDWRLDGGRHDAPHQPAALAAGPLHEHLARAAVGAHHIAEAQTLVDRRVARRRAARHRGQHRGVGPARHGTKAAAAELSGQV
eukprot:917863-Prymnesium_polylepis.1